MQIAKIAARRSAAACRIALGCGVILAASAIAARVQAAEFTMKLGLTSVDDSEHNHAKAIKAAVESASKGRVEVQIFPRGQLGSQSATIQGLQLGTVEGFITPADFYSGIDSRMGILSFPFIFKDRAHANRVMADAGIANKVADLLDPKGIIGCGQFASADVRYMTRNPIHKIADFNGKKMRINGTDAERERFKRLGATSVAMNLADMLTALQNGTIDGSGSGITIWVNFNLETVSKELLQTEDTLILSYCGMSKKWLDSMPADLRQTVIQASRSVFPQAAKGSDEFNDSLGKKWAAKGGVLNHLSEADMKEFRDKLATVGETVTEGKPEMRAFYDDLKAASAKMQ